MLVLCLFKFLAAVGLLNLMVKSVGFRRRNIYWVFIFYLFHILILEILLHVGQYVYGCVSDGVWNLLYLRLEPS